MANRGNDFGAVGVFFEKDGYEGGRKPKGSQPNQKRLCHERRPEGHPNRDGRKPERSKLH